MSNNVKFVYAQSEKFYALENKDSNTLYFLEDTQQIYKGDVLFSSGKLSKLIFGNNNIIYDGSEEVHVPEYDGEYGIL